MPARYFDAEPRAYSPSRPLASSSDNEEEVKEKDQVDEELQDDAASGYSSQEETFIPQREVNAFQITSEELNKLSLQTGSNGVVLTMHPGSAFAFVGVCSVTVLRGAISLSGVRLYASTHSHPVFSPKSSSLALLKAIGHTSADSVITLPAEIKKTGDASIVLLQPLKTGIESLGKYRLLSHLFHINESERNLSADQTIGIDGLYFVSKRLVKSEVV